MIQFLIEHSGRNGVAPARLSVSKPGEGMGVGHRRETQEDRARTQLPE